MWKCSVNRTAANLTLAVCQQAPCSRSSVVPPRKTQHVLRIVLFCRPSFATLCAWDVMLLCARNKTSKNNARCYIIPRAHPLDAQSGTKGRWLSTAKSQTEGIIYDSLTRLRTFQSSILLSPPYKIATRPRYSSCLRLSLVECEPGGEVIVCM